jgi:hypothetical protein
MRLRRPTGPSRRRLPAKRHSRLSIREPGAFPPRCDGPYGSATAADAGTWTAAGVAAMRPAISNFTTSIRSRRAEATTRTTSSFAARPTTSTRPISTSAGASWMPGAAPVCGREHSPGNVAWRSRRAGVGIGKRWSGLYAPAFTRPGSARRATSFHAMCRKKAST